MNLIWVAPPGPGVHKRGQLRWPFKHELQRSRAHLQLTGPEEKIHDSHVPGEGALGVTLILTRSLKSNIFTFLFFASCSYNALRAGKNNRPRPCIKMSVGDLLGTH